MSTQNLKGLFEYFQKEGKFDVEGFFDILRTNFNSKRKYKAIESF